MRIQPIYHAFMICIRTIENSDPSLLANIDPQLVIRSNISKENYK